MSQDAKYKFALAWLVILTVAVTILSVDRVTSNSGREQRITEWKARMMQDSLDRAGIPARVDSVVDAKLRKESNILQVEMPSGLSTLDKLLIAAITGIVGLAGILIRNLWNALQNGGKKYVEQTERHIAADDSLRQSLDLYRVTLDSMFEAAEKMHENAVEAIKTNGAKLDALDKEISGLRREVLKQ